MNRQLYLECYSGISGDMTVGALLDLGADQKRLEEALTSLPVDGFELKISRVKKSGLDACDFAVLLDKVHENHDHDMEYLHGDHAVHHMHHGETETQKHVHTHTHRGLAEIREIIAGAAITERAKTIAGNIFEILAEAEAKAHGVPVSEVHFHEVGAVDSIVDIVAVSVCLDDLDITEVIVPELWEGRGFINCQHGQIPVPVPAVVHIASAYGLGLHLTKTEGELVTPTGAAIVAAVRTKDRLPEHFQILRTGIGTGKRSYDRPSLLRAMLIADTDAQRDVIWKLESNIDDTTGEAMGFVMEELLRAGARDVHYIPVFMKKNRPAYQLNVICDETDIVPLEHIIFRQTTTIGIRRQKMERTVLKREIRMIRTSFGEVRAKICSYDGEVRIYPEYEDVAAVSREQGLGYGQVYHQLIQEFWQQECINMSLAQV